MAKLLNNSRIYGTGTVDTQLLINGQIGSHSTSSGVLQLKGGAGIWGGVFVSGVVTATTFAGKLNGSLTGGTAGQLVYQSAADTTAFAGPGTAGQVLTSGGTGAPTYVSTTTLYVGRALTADSISGGSGSVSTVLQTNNATYFPTFVDSNNAVAASEAVYTTSSFTVNPATGRIGINTAVAESTLQVTGDVRISGVSTVTNNTVSTNTTTGALQVIGGVGIGGDVNIGGTVVGGSIRTTSSATAPTNPTVGDVWYDTANDVLYRYTNDGTTSYWIDITGPSVASAGSGSGDVIADNLAGGILGQIPYQLAAGSTAFIGTGTQGSILQMSANTATFVTTANIYVNSAVNAQTIFGGTAGQLHYQSGAGVTAFAGPGSAGQILVSAGTSAPTYTSTGSIYVGFANQSNNLLAGTAGQLVYQSAAGTTAFAGPGTAGQILTSGGTGAPTYVSTTTLYVNRAVTADSATGSAGSVANALTISTGLTGSPSSTYNGSAAITVTLNTATLMATAVNLVSGTAGQVPYQTGAGATSFFGPGTAGQVLTSGGTGAPTYVTTTTLYVGRATTADSVSGTASLATDVAGGTAGQLLYQIGANDTGFVGPGTLGQLLVSGGAAIPVYTNTASIQVGFAATAGVLLAANTTTQQVGYAANLLAGTAGQIAYQSAANTTSFAGPGTAGQVLTSGGTGAPTYVSTSTLYVNRAVTADSATGGATLTGTETLTNKRITPRVNNNGATTSGTITPTGDSSDQFELLGLTGTVTVAAPSGTPTAGQKLTLRIKDNGTTRTLNWTTTAGGYRIIGTTLPTATTANKNIYVGCIYNNTDGFWDVVAVASEV